MYCILTPYRLAYITNIYKSQTEALIGSEKRAWEINCTVFSCFPKEKANGRDISDDFLKVPRSALDKVQR